MTRQLFLRLMLIALAASAIMAIASIYASSDIAWRILATTLIAAVACALMIPVAPREGSAGMDGLQRTVCGYLAIAFAVCMLPVWDIRMGSRSEFLLGLWFSVGIPALALAIAGLRGRRNEDRSRALAEHIAIGGASGAILLALVVDMLCGSLLGATWEYALMSGFVCVAGSIVASASALGRRTASSARIMPAPAPEPIDRVLGTLGMVAGTAWVTLAVMALVHDGRASAAALIHSSSDLWPLAVMCMAVALPCAIWCAIGLSRVTGPARFLRHAAAGSALALGAVVSFAVAQVIWTDVARLDDMLARLIGALAVVGASSLLAALVMMRLSMGRCIVADPIESLAWTCPRCATRGSIGLGEHCCAACGLAVHIELRDDRCPGCGYDLRGQPAGAVACPECGRTRQMPGQAAAAAARSPAAH